MSAREKRRLDLGLSMTHVLAADCLNDIVRGRAEQFCNDGKLVDMILAGEEGLALEHFGENAAGAPNVHLDIIFLPREHYLRRPVVSRGNIAGHLRVLNPGKAKVADLQIAVLVDEDIAGLEIAMDDAGRVDIFQSALQRYDQPLRAGDLNERSGIGGAPGSGRGSIG